jgi:hypothetical protein
LTSGEVVFVNSPEPGTTRGFGVVADSVPGEKALHVRVSNLSFQLLQIETGVRTIDACGALFFLHCETGYRHWQSLSRRDQGPAVFSPWRWWRSSRRRQGNLSGLKRKRPQRVLKARQECGDVKLVTGGVRPDASPFLVPSGRTELFLLLVPSRRTEVSFPSIPFRGSCRVMSVSTCGTNAPR